MGSTVVEPLMTRLPAQTLLDANKTVIAITAITKLLDFIFLSPLFSWYLELNG
jgi:hypothetical protein